MSFRIIAREARARNSRPVRRQLADRLATLSSTGSVNLHHPLGGSLRLVESPRPDFLLKEFIKFRRGPPIPMLVRYFFPLNTLEYAPSRLGNQEPHSNSKG